MMTVNKAISSTRTSNEFFGDSFKTYLDNIGQIPLLSMDEEQELVRKIREGGVDAENARECMINSNLRYVVSVAKRYTSYGLELPELVSEGNMGLIAAVDHFDSTKGFKFISYAVWWIRQFILQAISKRGSVSIISRENEKN